MQTNRLNATILKSHRFTLRFVIVAAVGATLLGCGRKVDPIAAPVVPGGPIPTAPTAPVIAPADFKVALVMSGPKSDNGWNSGASKALDSVKSELELSDAAVKSVDNQTDAANQAKSCLLYTSRCV